MRVLHLNSGNLFGGIENALVTMARRRFDCPALEVEFGCCFDARASRILRNEGVPVHILGEVKLSRPWKVTKARRTLRRVLSSARYDAVICHGPWTLAAFGPEIRRSRVGLVFWTHDRCPRPMPWLERLARRNRPDLVVCNSRYTETGVPLFANVPSEVIYCPVVPPEEESDAGIREFIRERQGVKPDDTVILQVSRLDPHKGHELHLEALSELREIPGWVCWIVSGAQRPAEQEFLERLKSLAARLNLIDRVKFLGWQANVEDLFLAADIYCQPNVAPEPFGLTFIEALWRRVPVIATTLGGPLEIVDSSCGVLVEPNSRTLLANALRTLVEHPELRRALGERGPSRAENLCLPARQMQRLSAAIETHVRTA
jgi:glycosyltransferase involved in cell wall biosynthesis